MKRNDKKDRMTAASRRNQHPQFQIINRRLAISQHLGALAIFARLEGSSHLKDDRANIANIDETVLYPGFLVKGF